MENKKYCFESVPAFGFVLFDIYGVVRGDTTVTMYSTVVEFSPNKSNGRQNHYVSYGMPTFDAIHWNNPNDTLKYLLPCRSESLTVARQNEIFYENL